MNRCATAHKTCWTSISCRTQILPTVGPLSPVCPTGNSADMAALSDEIHDCPVPQSDLDVFFPKGHQFCSSESASEQDGDHCYVTGATEALANTKRMHRYGTPSLGTSREKLQSSSPSGFPERISVTPIRRNPPCNSFSTCRNMELVLRWVFGTGLQEASVAPAGTLLRPKSPALLASRATRRATALEKWLSPGTPRAYLQRLLSRQKLLLL